MNTQTPAVLDDALMERMWKFAERVAPAKFIPQHLRGDVPTLFYALATGQDLGLTWTHALRSTFPGKDGGMGMKGDVMLALLLRNGFHVAFAFTEKPIGCTCSITRPGEDDLYERTFSMDDAQMIETRWLPEQERWERLSENWFYKNFPKEMCQWRSLAHCGRVAAADLLGGLYLPEELLYSGEKSASEPAPTGPSTAAVVDEFVVAEKKDEPAVETTSNVVEKSELSPVTQQEQRDEPAPEEAEKPAVSQASSETAAAAVETAAYEIWLWAAKGFMRHDVPDQDRADTAEIMAQALANQTGQQVKVVARQGDTRQDVLICEPPAKKTPEPPKPVTTFEVWGIMPDQKASQVQGESHPTPDAATKRAITLAEERKFTTLVVRVEGDSRKEISRHRPPNGTSAEEKSQDFDSMISQAREKIGGDHLKPEDRVKAADKLITRYLSGFMDLGVRSLPKDKAKLAPPLAKLMEVIDSKLGDLKADPEALGALLAGRTTSQLEQAFDKLSWPEHVRVLARKAMAAIPVSEDDFQLWLYHPMAGDSDKGTGVSLSSMEPRALEIFFPLMTLVKGTAWQVIDWAIERQFGVTAALEALEKAAEKPVAQWDEALAKEALAELSKFSTPKPEPKLPAAQDPPADQDDLFNAGLPFEN